MSTITTLVAGISTAMLLCFSILEQISLNITIINSGNKSTDYVIPANDPSSIELKLQNSHLHSIEAGTDNSHHKLKRVVILGERNS